MGERVHEKSFKLIKLFSVIGETTRRSATTSLRRPVFSLCGIFQGTPLINAANSLFPQKPQVCGQWGALCQKRGFGTRHKLFTLFLLR